MKVEFMGLHTSFVGGSTGCPVCGSKARSNKGFKRTKSITFPNGMTKSFTAFRVEDVSDYEADFLLSLTYKNAGEEVHMFRKKKE